MTTPNARLQAKCEDYVPKSKAEEFRKHAEACIRHAEECTEPSDKERWLKIAESWLERAREEEDSDQE